MASPSSAAAAGPVIAIDIGGTKIAIGRVTDGRCASVTTLPTPRTGRGDDLVMLIAGTLGAIDTAVGVATTGIVRHGCITALNPRTLPIEDGYPLAERLDSAIGRTPLVINDAQAAAWAEYRYGAGRRVESFVFMTVSTGVGGGLVLDGRLQVGPAGLAGHVGHMALREDGPPCGCGRTGCLEALASGTSIGARGTRIAGSLIRAPDVFDRARDDLRMRAVIDDAAAAVAQGIGNLVAVLDVQRVVLGGGVGLRPDFRDAVEAAVGELPAVLRCPVVPAQTGTEAGLIGVADLALKECFR